MEDLLNFLARNWWLLFILLPWIGSIIGDVFTKAAQKAAQEQRARRREARMGDRPGDLDSERARPVQTERREQRPTAEEVAAEIRRMMGMEVQEERRSPSGSRPVVVEETWEQVPRQEPQQQEPQQQEPEWQEPEWQEPEPAYEPQPLEARSLRQRLAEKQRLAEEQRRLPSRMESRHLQPAIARGGLQERHLETELLGKLQIGEGSRHLRRRAARALPSTHGIRAGSLAYLADPARAFVLLEVLGPPKALRDE